MHAISTQMSKYASKDTAIVPRHKGIIFGWLNKINVQTRNSYVGRQYAMCAAVNMMITHHVIHEESEECLLVCSTFNQPQGHNTGTRDGSDASVAHSPHKQCQSCGTLANLHPSIWSVDVLSILHACHHACLDKCFSRLFSVVLEAILCCAGLMHYHHVPSLIANIHAANHEDQLERRYNQCMREEAFVCVCEVIQIEKH